MAFGVLTEVVFSTVWQFLDAWLAGWWLAIGILLGRIQPGFARLSLALAAMAAIASVFTMLDVEVVRYASVRVFFVLRSAWSAWLLLVRPRLIPGRDPRSPIGNI